MKKARRHITALGLYHALRLLSVMQRSTSNQTSLILSSHSAIVMVDERRAASRTQTEEEPKTTRYSIILEIRTSDLSQRDDVIAAIREDDEYESDTMSDPASSGLDSIGASIWKTTVEADPMRQYRQFWGDTSKKKLNNCVLSLGKRLMPFIHASHLIQYWLGSIQT